MKVTPILHCVSPVTIFKMYVKRVNKDSAGSKAAFMMKKKVSLKRSKKQQLKLVLLSSRGLGPGSRDFFTQFKWRSH